MNFKQATLALLATSALGVAPTWAAPFEFSQVGLGDRVEITLSISKVADLMSLIADDPYLQFDPTVTPDPYIQYPAGNVAFSDAWAALPYVAGTAKHDQALALEDGFFMVIEDSYNMALGFLYTLNEPQTLHDGFKLLSFEVARPVGKDGVISLNALNFDLSAGYMNADNLGAPLAQTIVAMVPEPQNHALFAAGLGLLGWMARRMRGV